MRGRRVSTTLTTTREQLEALCRQAMAEAARIKPRGFDGQRDKARAVARCDSLLDEFNAAG